MIQVQALVIWYAPYTQGDTKNHRATSKFNPAVILMTAVEECCFDSVPYTYSDSFDVLGRYVAGK